MPYVPDATVGTEPLDSRAVASAALEFRTLKTWIQANLSTKLLAVVAWGAGAYTLQLTDNNKCGNKTDGLSVTIPANATIAHPVGTIISGVNNFAGGSQTLVAAGGVTVYLAGNTTPGNRTIAPRGMWTAYQLEANVWYVTGSGVT